MIFEKIRPLAYTVASRFDDRAKITILDVCERLRARSKPGTVLASRQAITAKTFRIYRQPGHSRKGAIQFV